MSLSLLQNVNFGRNRSDLTGSSGVGYRVLDVTGTEVTPMTTSGVYQTAPGLYAANVTYPDMFNGQIVWYCPAFGILSASYATEEQNFQNNDPRVGDVFQMVTTLTGTVQSLYDMSFGRWKIINNQMLFYATDNVTLIAKFDLYDDGGSPTMDGVFERFKV